jgi:uncharacterized protein (DUF4213/DUF364 family)
MIIDETVDLLLRLLGARASEITIERIVIGAFYTGVKLSDGSGGVAYTPVADLHHGSPSSPSTTERPAPAPLKGMAVSTVLAEGGTVLADLVRLVVLNALSSRFIMEGRYRVVPDVDTLDLLEPSTLGRVAMVGAITPFIRRLAAVPGVELSVIERKPESLKGDDARFYVPADDAATLIPACDTVIITGATASNGSIEDLLGYTRKGATVVVTGPTASLLPDAFFSRNVGIVSGVTVTDPDAALDTISEAVAVYHLFKTCIRKINIIK